MTGLLTLLGEVVRLVTQGVGDASAHALAGLSHSSHNNSVASAAQARRSAMANAYARLEVLLDDIAGPPANPVAGKVRDLRESVYRSYFKAWVQTIPEEDWAEPNPTPKPENISRIRSLRVHETDLRLELEPAIAAAKISLGKVVATSSLLDSKQLDRAFREWRDRTIVSINRAIDLAHGDASIAIERIAGRDVMKPELFDNSALED